MNKGVLQNNSPVQQMMATINPSLWNLNNLNNKPPFISSSPSNSSSSTITNFLLAPPPNNNNNNNNNNQNHSHNYMNMSTSSSSWLEDDHQPANNVHQDHDPRPPPFHDSWSQFLLGGGFMGEAKKMENWEEQVLFQQESSVNSYININNNNNNNNIFGTNDIQEIQKLVTNNNWSPCQINIPSSSPQSCVTNAFNNNNNMLDFNSKCINDDIHQSHNNRPTVANLAIQHNTTAKCVAAKKPKIQRSSSPSTFKVRKEKLGDRITALHQLVSPFGKTDTASVLLEAIGYIRFLHGQVEALSLPYLTSGSESMRQPNTVKEGRKCIFPEDPGQLLNNENGLKRKGGLDEDSYEEANKDLRSRGLCLVPLSYTMHVGNDNGADYWAPAIGGSFR